MDTRAESMLRQRVLGWLGGVVTKSGRDRALAVASCGRPVAALYQGQFVAVPWRCRDRFCPRCAALRSRELADGLRPWVDHRLAEGARLFALHLTQVKPHGAHRLRDALDTLLAHWRWRTNARTRGGREWHRVVAGAVRSLEVTWSAEGTVRSDGSVVPYDGWHAHLHVIVELRPNASEAELRALVDGWVEHVGGNRRAALVTRVHAGRDKSVYQLCKYIAKPLSVDMAPELGRLLARVTHGRRMHVAVGAWRWWKRWADRHAEPSPPLLYAAADTGPRAKLHTIRELVERWGGGEVPSTLDQRPTSLGALAQDTDVMFVAQRRGGEAPIVEVRSLRECVTARWSWHSPTGPPDGENEVSGAD